MAVRTYTPRGIAAVRKSLETMNAKWWGRSLVSRLVATIENAWYGDRHEQQDREEQENEWDEEQSPNRVLVVLYADGALEVFAAGKIKVETLAVPKFEGRRPYSHDAEIRSWIERQASWTSRNLIDFDRPVEFKKQSSRTAYEESLWREFYKMAFDETDKTKQLAGAIGLKVIRDETCSREKQRQEH